METEEAGDSLSAEDSSDMAKEAEDEEEDGGEEQNTSKRGGMRKKWVSYLL